MTGTKKNFFLTVSVLLGFAVFPNQLCLPSLNSSQTPRVTFLATETTTYCTHEDSRGLPWAPTRPRHSTGHRSSMLPPAPRERSPVKALFLPAPVCLEPPSRWLTAGTPATALNERRK